MLAGRDVWEIPKVFRNLLLIIWLLLERTWLRWRARLSGIDPDTIPEIQDLRRRYKERRRKAEDESEA